MKRSVYINNRILVNILNVGVDSTSTEGVLRFIRLRLGKSYEKGEVETPFIITTPNPEQIILAQKDRQFKKILNLSDISVCDAIGLAQASKFLSLKSPKNTFLRLPVYIFQGLVVGLATFINRSWIESELKVIKGRELFIKLISLANKKGWRVFLLGGQVRGEDTSQIAAKILQRNYKNIKISFANGPILNSDGKPIGDIEKDGEKEIVKQINGAKPQLLFVGFGAPKQEKWVYRWKKKLNVGGIMVLGGTFDYIAGRSKLPPKMFDKLGLEWLWRLLTGGQKISRILTAFPIFPIKVLLFKLRSNFESK